MYVLFYQEYTKRFIVCTQQQYKELENEDGDSITFIRSDEDREYLLELSETIIFV